MSTGLTSVLITGANRGLGLACAELLLARGVEVVATARTKEGVESILAHFGTRYADTLLALELDVASPTLPPNIIKILGEIDGLINNAGIGNEFSDASLADSVINMESQTLMNSILVNAEGPRRLLKHTLPGMMTRGFGRIANVSSARSSLGNWTGDTLCPAYRLSKLLLNGITVIASHEFAHSNVLINSVCPGWCQTRLGGPQAYESPEEGARRITELLFLPEGGPSGVFFSLGKPELF